MPNTQNINAYLTRNSHRVMAIMLLFLHAFLVWGDSSSYIKQAFFLCHYGFFLVWQPVWRGSEKLSWSASLFLLMIGGLGFYFTSWWLAAFWLAALFGLLGGRVLSGQDDPNRFSYILAASYLLAMLLLWVVPELLQAHDDIAAAKYVVYYFVPLLPACIFFTSRQPIKTGQAPVIDFFYTLLLMLIALILILSSFVIGTMKVANYIEVIFISVFGLAFTLVAFSWLWNPRSQFSGVELLMSRYLLSVGMPFEQWVKKIAAHAENKSSAKEFMHSAMQEITELEWVQGAKWLADEAQGQLGEVSPFATSLNFRDLHMTLYTRWQLSPALYLHVKLLVQILGEFYEAKRREETLRQNTYMQAFYETGSRLTHDIKNILQSVGNLCAAAEQSNADANHQDNEALLKLLRRQLPVLNQRIASTLDKLKAPSEDKKRQEQFSYWWQSLKQRYQHSQLEFITNEIPKFDINAEVLDGVLDNLLQNAIEKAKSQPDIWIEVELANDAEKFAIDVTDTGDAMPASVAQDLFKKHINSENGLGVGLYHAAKQAEQAGYVLRLVKNVNGEVQFRVELVQPH